MKYEESTIYREVVKLTNEYLGLSSKQLIDRQICNHLSKNPEDITESDLGNLLDWIKPMACVLIEDKQRANLFMRQLERLTSPVPIAG